MDRETLQKNINRVIDNLIDSCDRCASDDFKPSDCVHFHKDWEKEGRLTFCDLEDDTPINMIMKYVDEYKGKDI